MFKKTLSFILALVLAFGCFGIIGFSAETETTLAVSLSDFTVKSAEIVKGGKNSTLRIIGKLRANASAFNFPKAEEAALAENGLFLLSFANEADLYAALTALENSPAVLFAQRDVPVYTETLEQAESHLSWGPDAIEADAYANAIDPLGIVTVAVIDSGVSDIDFLKDRLVDGYDFYDNDADATNDVSVDSHGTFLASIIADCTGNLPVKIMPVRVLESETGMLSTIINGIIYAADNGADIINLSMCAPLTNCRALENAVAYAQAKNVTFVTCAGNTISDTETYCPSHCETAITVSSVNFQNCFSESFSNFGDEVDLTAPGEGIIGYNAAGEEAALSGTSMSAAFVSAAAAMFLVENPYCNTNQVRNALISCALDLGETGKDIKFGWGLPKLSKLAADNTVYVEDIRLDEENYTLEKGKSVTLNPVILPADATDKTYVITSDSGNVSVSGNVITAVSEGTATLTVTSNDGLYTAKAKITVTAAPPAVKIINSTGTKVINYGETLRMSAQAANVPEGTVIAWYVDGVKRGEGATFDLSPESGAVVTVKLIDLSGRIITHENGTEITASQTVNVKSGFFQKLISFFKNLFGISRLVIQ